jgi:hypothetical protein
VTNSLLHVAVAAVAVAALAQATAPAIRAQDATIPP